MAGETIPFKEQSELGEVFDNLDNDSQEDSGMSKVDFNARIDKLEMRLITVIDELTRKGLLPETSLTRQWKRLSVSLEGMGREEKTRIVSGQREHQSGGILQKIFTPRNDGNGR